MSYYRGVDGGGTKTAYALFDENKKYTETNIKKATTVVAAF